MARLLFQLAKLAFVALAIHLVARADAVWAQASNSRDAVARSPFTLRDAVAARTLVRDTALRFVPFTPIELPATFRDSIVRVAEAQVGRRYLFGGTTPQRGFDCSGFVRYVLRRVNIEFPRTAYLQARVGAPVGRGDLLPGDIVSFGPDSVSHIGIYVGDGRFVHASSVAGRVVVSRLDREPSAQVKPLYGARRLLAVRELPYNHALVRLAAR